MFDATSRNDQVKRGERMKIRLRRARAADGAGIAVCYLRSTAKLGFLRRCHDGEDMWRHFLSIVQNNETWVIVREGQIAAFLALNADEIEHLYVHPAHQKAGLGSLLLTHAKTRLDNPFHLWTFCQNKQARQFYTRHGLTAELVTDGRRNEEKLPDIKFVWNRK
jgi:GNAT superfamily N-acetyltransferase